ncbi:MAG: hypothetical protein NTW95_15090, partial [Candidatus Aminicenantes bacterium]|nr:hypothetical protein [Candidatus Aminicenantes bacterium]
IMSDGFIEKIRHLFDPKYDNEKYVKAFDFTAFKQKYGRYREKFTKLNLRIGSDSMNGDWCEEILAKRSLLAPLDPDLQVLCQRLRMMIDSKVFEDFISVDSDAPLPNLLAWLHAAKVYTAVNMLTALEGDWEASVSNLLDMVDFGKRAVKGSRFLIVNLIGKAIMALPLQAVAALMNRKECPAAVYEMVLKRMPTLEYEEFGTRQSLICEVLAFNYDFIENPWHENPYRPYGFWERMFLKLFLVKNQTRNYADEIIKQFIEMEQTPPWQWKNDTIAAGPIKTGPFWWLWNAGGKLLLESYNDYAMGYKKGEGIYAVIFKTEKSVPEILDGLDSYKVLDPCSGKPYVWNGEKQVLYSIGTDRVDNGGTFNKATMATDVVLPCVLYIRAESGQQKKR